MDWPDWIEDNKWRWIIGTIIAIITAVAVPLVLTNSAGVNQTSNTNGDNNTTLQLNNSTGNTFNINTVDPEALARELAKHLPDQQDFAKKEEEIKELEATIERLQKDSADELKQQALQALKEGDTERAVVLLEKSAQARTEKAAQDYIDIGNIAYLNDPQKALGAYEKAVTLAPSNLDAWNRTGAALYRLGQLGEAQHAHEKVLELAGRDKTFQAAAYGNLGMIYQTRGELDKAEEYFLKSLDIGKGLGWREDMASQYGNLGMIYQTRGELDRAEEYFLKALVIDKELGWKEGMASQYNSLGNIYFIREDLNKAEEYCLKALDINKELGKDVGMACIYGNLGNVYGDREELDKAEEYHLKSLGIDKELGRKEGMARTYGNLGNLYKTRGELDRACGYWQQSLQLFTEIGAQDSIDRVRRVITENCKEKE